MKKEQQVVAAYEPPKVEVIEVEVEKGFAASESSVNDYPGGWNTDSEVPLG